MMIRGIKMTYNKRFDGRKFDETRPIEARAGVIPRADGSGYFKIGHTEAYAAVYGPRNLFPKFMQNPQKGILRCKYNMMPFSGSGDRVRPGTSRRSKEISWVTEQALLPALNLEDFPNSVVDIFIELPQTDAGTRAAGICAASIAIADAGLTMKGLVSAIACGRVGDKIVVDLTKEEEDFDGEGGVADIPVAMIPELGIVTLLQMDGHLKPDELDEAMRMAKEALISINEVQKNALKERYSLR
ncbi:MAG: exosome complex exonuclease Rrp41 [Candidatus Woesearchaeota archaeon]